MPQVAGGSRDLVLRMVPRPRDRRLVCELRGPRDEPMPGAEVNVRSALVMSKIAEGKADSNGLVTFDGLPAGRLTLIAFDRLRTGERKNWYHPRFMEVTPEGQTVVLRFRETVYTAGTLRDVEGEPVRGCRVELRGADGKVITRASTDSEGAFRIRTAADEAGPLTIFAGHKAPDGKESEVTLRGVEAGDEGLVITFRR